MAEWKFDQGKHYNSAERQCRSENVLLEFDDDSLNVSYEIGSGFCKESARFHIPTVVLKALLEHAGYTVSR